MSSHDFHVIINVYVKDAEAFKRYFKGHIPSIKEYGGEVLGAFDRTESFIDPILQGDAGWNFLAIQKWPSKEVYLKWWESDSYRPWRELRATIAEVRTTFAEESSLSSLI